jgi:hypothetical protein
MGPVRPTHRYGKRKNTRARLLNNGSPPADCCGDVTLAAADPVVSDISMLPTSQQALPPPPPPSPGHSQAAWRRSSASSCG